MRFDATSRSSTTKSRWSRFFDVFVSDTRWNERNGPPVAVGPTTT